MANKIPYPKTKKCKGCGEVYDRQLLSHRGLCPNCIYRRVRQCVIDLQTESGIYYDRWLEGCKRARERKAKEGYNA